ESMEDSPSAKVPMEAVDPRFRIGAMIVGVRRFPFLRAMLPERQAGTKDCAECHGTGDLNTEQLSGILCITCGGLGWCLEE
ncbi:MAG: hypothetical protein Q8R07_00030, partial [Candidatus Uhrbacteria bacterium]|nr:hypothetical protein [Candidatus Uhrbacteria bacterium]